MRRSRYGPGLAAALIVVLGAVSSWLINQLNLGARWGVTVLVATGVVVLAAAVLQFWLSTRRGGRIDSRVAAVKPADWAVARPRELERLVGLLVGGAKEPVGVTTGLHGAGGFGKTTLARMVCQDRRVRRRFRGGSYELTVGQDVRGAALADKINSAVEFLTGQRPAAADPEQAGQQLAAALRDGPARLLVIDDVWSAEQLGPFLYATGESAVLVTTRVPAILPVDAGRVTVDQMSAEQARQVLGYGLDPLPRGVARDLVAAAGGWALLLSLINADLRATARDGGDVVVAARAALERLARFGPTAFDVTEAGDRGKAVRATLDASLSRLSPAEVDRFCELGIVAEDARAPVGVVARLWRSTEDEARRLCQRLDQLSLLRLQQDAVVLHDVVRAYLRHRLGAERLAAVNAALLDGLAEELGVPERADGDVSLSWYASEDGLRPRRRSGLAAFLMRERVELIGPPRTAWWRLADDEGYLWRNLPYHLEEAGRTAELERLALDLRWVGGKLRLMGPAAAAGDVAASAQPPAVSLVRVLEQSAHLLGATEPGHAVVSILLSRLAGRPIWYKVLDMAYRRLEVPALRPRWPLADAFDPALRRVLHGHGGDVEACAIAPDGTWLATGAGDWTVRVSDAGTGHTRAVLRGHDGPVKGCAIAPDGTWLASVSREGTVRLWDAATGAPLAVLPAPRGGVNGCAIAPDGSWLAFACGDHTVQIWDVGSRRLRTVLTGHTDAVFACAVAPDGGWLLSAGRDHTLRIWDLATGETRAVLEGHTGVVYDCAIAPDGRWVASVSSDGTVRTWDAATGAERLALDGPGDSLVACAIAPDGTWLAVAGQDHVVCTYDAGSGRLRSCLRGHTDYVQACAIAPDGSWLASSGADSTVRIWDADAPWSGDVVAVGPPSVVFGCAIASGAQLVATCGADNAIRIWDTASGELRQVLKGHTHFVVSCAFGPDGSWLASAGDRRDSTVRLWDLDTGEAWAVLEGHTGGVNHCAIAPNGTWLASSSADGTVRLWGAETGESLGVLEGHTDRVYRCAIAPDGSWLASASEDGTVRLWDFEAGEPFAVLEGHTGTVVGCAIAPDGTWLASASVDGTVRLWDAATGQSRGVLEGHTDRVLDCAIGPDGRWLVSVGVDRTAVVWDVATLRCATLIRLEHALNAVEVHGNLVLTVGDRGRYLFELLGY